MNSAITSLIVFVIVFGGAILGMFLHSHLPQDHLNEDSKRVLNIGTGIIGTMAALVLGLLVASAKGNYDTHNNEVLDVSAKLVLLDRILAQYGPDASATRQELRQAVTMSVDRIWPEDRSAIAHIDPNSRGAEQIFEMIQDLAPTNDAQRTLKTQALSLAMSLGQTRWLLYAQNENTLSKPLIVILVFWLTINFISLGLFAPRNATVIAALLLCALAVSGAIFLILDMYEPFKGLVHISSAPLRNIVEQMGR